VGWWFQCGHCKNLKPVYEKVALAFKNEKNVSRDHVDASTPLSHSVLSAR
jgi:hypothetical protein